MVEWASWMSTWTVIGSMFCSRPVQLATVKALMPGSICILRSLQPEQAGSELNFSCSRIFVCSPSCSLAFYCHNFHLLFGPVRLSSSLAMFLATNKGKDRYGTNLKTPQLTIVGLIVYAVVNFQWLDAYAHELDPWTAAISNVPSHSAKSRLAGFLQNHSITNPIILKSNSPEMS